MKDISSSKISRLLAIYTKLINGCVVNKKQEADYYGVHLRSIQRDLEDIRDYFEQIFMDGGTLNQVVYDRRARGYRLEQIYREKLTSGEILAVCKILLDSRAFPQKAMKSIIDKLLTSSVAKQEQKQISELIRNEEFHYVAPRHGKNVIDYLWQIGQAIRNSNYITISYTRMTDKKTVERKLKPAALMFSEYYFYLAAFIDDAELQNAIKEYGDPFPTIYRVDRIKKIDVLDEKFYIPYLDRFEEGEFRKRVQFMFSGRLQTVKFKYYGNDANIMLDRLPTAKVIDETDDVYTISAEVYGDGIYIWLNSFGDYVEIIDVKEY